MNKINLSSAIPLTEVFLSENTAKRLLCFDDLHLLSARDIKNLSPSPTDEQMIDWGYERQQDINHAYLKFTICKIRILHVFKLFSQINHPPFLRKQYEYMYSHHFIYLIINTFKYK